MTDSNLTGSETESVRVRFNAKLPFSPLPPYEELFAERVPLITAFSLALGECLRKQNAGLAKVFYAAECGVYTGSSLLACAKLAVEYGVNVQFLGFDTFKGLPKLSEEDRRLAPENARYLTESMFADTSLEAVKALVDEGGYTNIKLISGLFSRTFPQIGEREYCFVNIDCDLYEGHLECLRYFYPRMAKGGILFFDDYHSLQYPMGKKAVDTFLKDKPEKLFHLRYGQRKSNHTKAYLLKY
jgi:hypothetical protein